MPNGTAFLLDPSQVRQSAARTGSASPAADVETTTRWRLWSPQWRRRTLLAALLLAAVLLGGRGITSEASVSLQGDMPRYLMNGVFLHDFLASGSSWTLDGVVRYAERYYARYPALTLGHHPPLLSAALVPVYTLFGVSVFWSRFVVVAFFLVAAGSLFSLARRLYDVEVAGWATLLFVTNPFVVGFAQEAVSEMPMLALVVATMLALVRFLESRRTRHYVWFMAGVAASVYAKQLTIYMWPVYALFLIVSVGWRRLIQRDVVLTTLAGMLLSAPMLIGTFWLSPFNVAVVRRVTTRGVGFVAWRSILSQILDAHLTLPLLLVVLIGAAVSIGRRDRRLLFSLTWLAGVLCFVVFLTGRFEPARYAIMAVPAYFLCAASLIVGVRWKPARWAAIALLSFVVGWQVWVGRQIRPTGAGGYETAAQYVVGQGAAPTVLFSGPVDTGYFVFFIRKHDPSGRLVVLRSDKVLTTSRMERTSVEDRITSREDIYTMLRRYGTRFVVIEDLPSGSRVLDWLREEVKTDKFTERMRIPIATGDRRLRGVNLEVYEFNGATPPDPQAELDLKIPLVGREIKVRLSDLMGGRR